MTDAEIKKKIEEELDKAEAIWKQVKDKFLIEKSEMYADGGKIPSKLPGFPFLEDGKPKVADFIALVLDIRGSTKHLIQAIATTTKVSQLSRVLYETTAINAAGILIINEKNEGITEFLGDGFLAFFKVKKDQKAEEVYRAHNVAKKCISVTKTIINPLLHDRYGLPPLEIGIGLAFSTAIVTIIGSGNNLHPKAIGECVYRASNLSFGRNEIFIDDQMEKLWPTEKNGKLKFIPITNKNLPPNRHLDFNGFKIDI
jgi:class 3 adenylate cyclase